MHPLLERDRVQVVDQQQARHSGVVRSERGEPLAVRPGLEQAATIAFRPSPYIATTAATSSSASSRA